MKLLHWLAAATLSLSGAATIAAPTVFHTTLGPEAVGATGSGTVTLVFESTTNLLSIDADWSGLTGTTTIAHIHCCVSAPGTVAVAVTPGTLPGFPAGVTSGSYNVTLDLDDEPNRFTAGFITNFGGGTVQGAIASLLQGMANGTAYFNIHSTAFPTGEIRGFLAVPEPASLAMAAFGLAGLLASRRRRR